MPDMGSRVDKLSPAKRALLEQRLLDRRAARANSERNGHLRKLDRGDVAPLSFAQELLWSLQQLAPDTVAYNVPRPAELRGPLDVNALERALTTIVERHEVLRTNIVAPDGEPQLVVSEDPTVPFEVIDLLHLAESDREEVAEQLMEEAARRPFDLATDRMLRVTVIRIGAEWHQLLLASHHIASDGWSTGVLFRELAALYDAYTAGAPAALPELPLQYADYAAWQRGWFESEAGRAQLQFWRQNLDGAPDVLELPTDRPRPAVQTYNGGRRSFLASQELHEAAARLSREEGATLFMTLLAGFGVLLGRYTGQDDIVVGSPIAGRNAPEVEQLIGYFSNALPLRIDLSGDPTFRECLARVRRQAVDAFSNAEMPFEKLVQDRGNRRDLSHTPIYQVLFVLQNVSTRPPPMRGLTTTRPKLDPRWAKFDLTLSLGERATGLNATWEYSSDLFDEATIERFARNYEALLEAAVADPDCRISQLPVPRHEELQQVIAGSRGSAAPAPAAERLDLIVARQASERPDAPALIAEGNVLSYAELDARVNKLANHLEAVGVRAGSRVAVCTQPGWDGPVALLASMRAGAAYVPLDRAHPHARLVETLDDAAPAALITDSTLVGDVPQFDGPVIRLDDDAAAIGARDEAAPSVDVAPDDLAYVIYTSGSTGRPKGVMVEHRSATAFAAAAAERYTFSDQDRVLQFASLSSDISVEELFASFAAGAAVVLRTDATPLAGSPFVRWLEEQRITVLDLPTAFWHEWVDDLARSGLEPPAPLKTVIVGGEAARGDAYRQWRSVSRGRVRWFNTYGPTEGTVVATVHEPDDGDAERQIVPIGRPLPGVTTYVLNGDLRPQPLGAYGELCIAGPTVARGYLGQPEATAERFVADPFAHEPGARMYRTGDVVRQRADGVLEFAGRVDRQVKVRGFRVEPAEVEAALRELSGVGDAVVSLMGGERAGGSQLVAHVVPDGEPVPSETLRAALAERLPPGFVPTAIVNISEIPMTPNGKIDQAALPRPEAAAGTSDHVAPRDDVERRLAAIWEEILELESVGPHDDFFQLGGHSLLAIRVFARIEQTFGKRLPLATLFRTPTLAALADEVRADAPEDDAPWPLVTPIQQGTGGPALFVAPDIRGDVLIGYRRLAGHLGADRPVYALRSRGLEGRSEPRTSIEDIAAEFADEIRRIQPSGPYYLAGHCFGGNVAVEISRRLSGAGERTPLLALIDSTPYGHRRSRRRLVYLGKHIEAARRGAVDVEYLRTRMQNARHRFARQLWWKGGERLYRIAGRLPRTVAADVTEANVRAAGKYVAPRFAGRVMLFFIDRGPEDARDRLRWSELASDGADVHTIAHAGVDHLSVMRQPYIASIAIAIKERMQQIEAADREARE